MLGLGWLLATKGWFKNGGETLISRLVIGVSLPAYLVHSLLTSYDRDKLVSILPGLPVPFASMIISILLAWGIAIAIRIPRGRRGAFVSMFAMSNTLFIGSAVNVLLFGDAALPFALLYYIANTTLFWTVCVYGIACDGAARAGRPAPSLLSLSGLKRVLSPPLMAFIGSVVIILLGIRLPKPVMDFCRYTGNMTTGLSMIFVGITISHREWKKLRFSADLGLVLAGRFIVSPLIAYFMMKGTGLPLLMKQVFLLQASMPAMTQTPLVAAANGADSEYVAIGTSLSTVLGLATIPIYMGFIGQIF